MSITQTFEKRRLIITLGENEAPSAWEWEGVTFTRNDDGSDAAPPFTEKRAATSDEVTAHIGKASTDQVSTFNRFNAQLADRDTEIADKTTQLGTTTAERDMLKGIVDAVTAAVAVKQ